MANLPNSNGSGGGCPVSNSNNAARSVSTAASPSPNSWNPLRWFSTTAQQTTKDTSETLPCPAPLQQHMPFSSRTMVAASTEEAANYSQCPRADQSIPLSTQRTISSIPRVDDGSTGREEVPLHQPPKASNWVYPSEQQFYNAMRRKGWSAEEETIPHVVMIHNAVNEKGWSHIQRWESALHSNSSPRLVRFVGRPNDTSPNAFLNTYLWMCTPPFDRHDWFVERKQNNGAVKVQRYVIDFYNGQPTENDVVDQQSLSKPPSLYLDVRPAIDDPQALYDRLRMFVRDVFPGICASFPTTNGTGVSTKNSAAQSNTLDEEEPAKKK